MIDGPGGAPRPSRPGRLRATAVRRGAGMLPSMLTVGNLFAGFFAIMAATDERYVPAAAAVVAAAFLDMIDGRIARLTGAVSDFGMELDSLSDAVSFGVAPAVLLQQWALAPLNRVGWGAAFLMAACGVIRLARYNARSSLSDRRYFRGLPIPMAGCAVSGLVLVFESRSLGTPPAWAAAAMAVLLGLLMVSSVRYRTFKEVDPRGRPYLATALLAMGVAALLAEPEGLLLLGAAAYVALGPAEWLYRRRGREVDAGSSGETPGSPEEPRGVA